MNRNDNCNFYYINKNIPLDHYYKKYLDDIPNHSNKIIEEKEETDINLFDFNLTESNKYILTKILDYFVFFLENNYYLLNTANNVESNIININNEKVINMNITNYMNVSPITFDFLNQTLILKNKSYNFNNIIQYIDIFNNGNLNYTNGPTINIPIVIKVDDYTIKGFALIDTSSPNSYLIKDCLNCDYDEIINLNKLKIGNTNLFNKGVYILDEKFNQEEEYDLVMIIGMDILSMFSEITFDLKKRLIYIKNDIIE